MNPLEQQLDYPLGDTQPEAGHVFDVAPGIRWVRMPLPFVLDHVNLWLLRDCVDGREGWTVVDCGISRDEVKAHWEHVFAHGMDGLPIVRVLVTHMHPDHVGLADWLCERFEAPLAMTLTDYTTARLFSQASVQGGATGGENAAQFFRRHGMLDEGALQQLRERRKYYNNLVPSVPPSFDRIVDNQMIEIGGKQWQIIIGEGHAPEHASLYCAQEKIFIAGDMVLPRISTNVSVNDMEPNADPLRLYLTSLDKYTFMPEDTLVLPSHGRPFLGLHTRIQQQRDHHAARLDEVRTACAERAMSAADVVPIMFHRKLDLHQLTFALGEALAHLHMLYFQGVLRRFLDDQNVIRFETV
ncbi:MBL fold metallo-hydrolase [Verticiella sediminum]|uniref:MBL fold metallo-hydrolase n=1 Tax=Verticiella sediminum TaxID=1247510 RepID=A0A556B1V0_9BURK|nr:MBL fold metallo-hydrolase [Verticiella sediminum]TSH99168.1 MBL fold metallo-hydrolase [Verticiella sediminum]